MKIPIVLTMWIYLVHEYPFQLLNPILWRMCMFNNYHLVPVIHCLCYLEVAWSWRKIFVLMASGILNIAHPNMQFNVLHSKKPWCSNAKQRSTFAKSVSGIPIPCYLGFWVEYHNKSFKHHKHWFCPYDLSCCVGGTIWKFAIARPRVPTIWPIQEGTNLT
jgi:hypothetical protein